MALGKKCTRPPVASAWPCTLADERDEHIIGNGNISHFEIPDERYEGAGLFGRGYLMTGKKLFSSWMATRSPSAQLTRRSQNDGMNPNMALSYLYAQNERFQCYYRSE